MSKYKAKDQIRKARLGLYRKPQAIDKVDGRTKPRKAWKAFVSGIQDDLGGGPLSFGQRALCELAFWKYFCLSEFVGTLLRSKKDGAILSIMTNQKFNTTFNTTANSCRGDLRDIYGPAGIKKAEKKMEDLHSYIARTYGGSQAEPEKTADARGGDGKES